MKVTYLFLRAMDVIYTLHQQGEPINVKHMAERLEIKGDIAAYFEEISKENLIAPVAKAAHGGKCYELTGKGEQLCERIDRVALKDACEKQQVWQDAKLRFPAFRILIIIGDLREKGKKVWPNLVAGKAERSRQSVYRTLQSLERKGLVSSRLETAQESYADVSQGRRRLYELTDVGRKLLEVFR